VVVVEVARVDEDKLVVFYGWVSMVLTDQKFVESHFLFFFVGTIQVTDQHP
jgi:hypothetical protein